MQRVCRGDLFCLSLPVGGYLAGRVLLDIEQCFASGAVTHPSRLDNFADGLLIEIYSEVLENPAPHRGPNLVPGCFMTPTALSKGHWPIVGHVQVLPSEIDFPETLIESSVRAL